MYKILRNFLFLFDPERVHYFSMKSLRFLCKAGFIKRLIRQQFKPTTGQPFSLFKINFPNRIGLGAGFDKNARYLRELETLGFGFVEIGTVTPLPQAGNDRPRLFRLPKDKALVNRMGFNNDGVEVIAGRLKEWRKKTGGLISTDSPGQSSSLQWQPLIIGGNIGKNKITPNGDAWKDYEKCFLALHGLVDYFVVNVSSPNTPGLRELQEKDSLRKILTNLQGINANQQVVKPILLKIAPDLSREQIDDVIDLAMEIKLDGLVATNTTIDRSGLSDHSKLACEKIGAGGLSGMPLRHHSTEIISYIQKRTAGTLAIIGSGGIFSGADAKEKLGAGASLVQVWTGFIYEGPAIVKNISTYLAGRTGK